MYALEQPVLTNPIKRGDDTQDSYNAKKKNTAKKYTLYLWGNYLYPPVSQKTLNIWEITRSENIIFLSYDGAWSRFNEEFSMISMISPEIVTEINVISKNLERDIIVDFVKDENGLWTNVTSQMNGVSYSVFCMKKIVYSGSVADTAMNVISQIISPRIFGFLSCSPISIRGEIVKKHGEKSLYLMSCRVPNSLIRRGDEVQFLCYPVVTLEHFRSLLARSVLQDYGNKELPMLQWLTTEKIIATQHFDFSKGLSEILEEDISRNTLEQEIIDILEHIALKGNNEIFVAEETCIQPDGKNVYCSNKCAYENRSADIFIKEIVNVVKNVLDVSVKNLSNFIPLISTVINIMSQNDVLPIKSERHIDVLSSRIITTVISRWIYRKERFMGLIYSICTANKEYYFKKYGVSLDIPECISEMLELHNISSEIDTILTEREYQWENFIDQMLIKSTTVVESAQKKKKLNYQEKLHVARRLDRVSLSDERKITDHIPYALSLESFESSECKNSDDKKISTSGLNLYDLLDYTKTSDYVPVSFPRTLQHASSCSTLESFASDEREYSEEEENSLSSLEEIYRISSWSKVSSLLVKEDFASLEYDFTLDNQEYVQYHRR